MGIFQTFFKVWEWS